MAFGYGNARRKAMRTLTLGDFDKMYVHVQSIQVRIVTSRYNR